jgi:uncharacterized protein
VAVRAIPRSRRRLLIAIAAVIVLAFIALNVLSTFYVDLLWFREVRFSSVFWTVFRTKVLLGVIFGAAFFVLLFTNLWIVRRITPRYRVFSPEQEIVERYRLALEPYMKWILPGLALIIALFVGFAATGQWQVFQLWRHSSGISFGQQDPVFHKDAAFYVFKLPFLQFLQGWLFSALVGVTVLAAIMHYLFGGIRIQAVGERVASQVKVHLSVLLGLIVLTKAWGYWLGRYNLLTSSRGVVTGASYTDIHVQKPALFFLMIVAIICAVLFLVNIRLRGWILPVLGLGLLAVVTVVAAIVAVAFQKFVVSPQELQKERPYIAANIDATRSAFGLDTIASSARPVHPALTSADVSNNSGTIQNIRLWDPALLKQDFNQLQRIKQYYEFQDVDVDRYPIDGQERMVMLSTREVSQNGIPNGKTWQNAHLVYTHGYGAVANEVNSTAQQGQPAFILQDIPPHGVLPITQPRVYYGERQDVPFVVTNTGVPELDYQGTATSDTARKTFEYTGSGGIKVGGFFGRMLFAWRYKDINLLISGLIHGDSRMLIYRRIQDRIPKPAPFLKYDGDPYSAIVDGRLVWIQDAYTATNSYPYSERLSVGPITGGHLTGQVNYIRNSVKVVVDAYTGKMTYYVVDPTDPIIQVWERIFPNLFTTTPAPADLQAHFRYPEDLFTVQATQYAKYHITSATGFYQRQDFWAVPADPAFAQNNNGQVTPLRPYYVVMRLPGSTQEEFVLILPFTPVGRNNMVAWMAAKSDPSDYGQVVSFQFPSGQNVDGPIQVFNEINNDPEFSSERTLLGRGGSSLLFGNFLVIPIGDSFLYVQPIFVQSNQAGSFPELKRVVVVQNANVGVGVTLEDALAKSLGLATPTTPTPTPSGGGGKLSQQVDQLLAQALQHFRAANAALKKGDLGTYQSEIQQANADIRQAKRLAAGSGGKGGGGQSPSPTPSPSPSPSASPSPSP